MGVLRRARAPIERLILHTPARRRSNERAVVLLRYFGRQSGDLHERAIALARDGSQLLAVFPRRAKDWWRDFRPSGPAVLVLDDLKIRVVGRAVDGAEEPVEVAGILRSYLDHAPGGARRLGLRETAPVAELEAQAARFIAVVFERPAGPFRV